MEGGSDGGYHGNGWTGLWFWSGLGGVMEVVTDP
jgi:hypothetical protein